MTRATATCCGDVSENGHSWLHRLFVLGLGQFRGSLPKQGLHMPRLSHGRVRMRLASSSPINASFDRVERHLAVEHPGNGRRMTGDVRRSCDVGIARRLRPRFHAVQEVADVRLGVDLHVHGDLCSSAQRLRIEGDLAAVARLHPAFFSLESHLARPEVEPALSIMGAHHQFGSVGVPGVHDAFRRIAALRPDRLEFHRRRAVGLVGPLAQIDGVAGPIQKSPAGIEVEAAQPSPNPGDVRVIVRPPRSGPSHRSQSSFSLGGSGSAGSHSWTICGL